MSQKLTQDRVNTLVETLSSLICENELLTREQRENMVKTVAILGGLHERLGQVSASKEVLKQAKAEKAKKTREPNAVFPRTGKIWTQEEAELIHSIIDDIPDQEVDNHILWLSGKLGRTPYAIALKILNEGRMNAEWSKTWKEAAKEIREKHKAAATAAEEQISETNESEA